jgi:hypothetical protein
MRLSQVRPCVLCKRNPMHHGLPLFFTLTVRRLGVPLRDIQRHLGLAGMLGSLPLANVMGVEPEAQAIAEAIEVTVCEPCATDRSALLWQVLEESNRHKAEPVDG